jgi:hypothetical protein
VKPLDSPVPAAARFHKRLLDNATRLSERQDPYPRRTSSERGIGCALFASLCAEGRGGRLISDLRVAIEASGRVRIGARGADVFNLPDERIPLGRAAEKDARRD